MASSPRTPEAVIRRSQYVEAVSGVLRDSRRTTLRLAEAHYLMRLLTPISSITPLGKHGSAPNTGRYPAPLMQEYDALTDKKLRRTITPHERIHLQEVRNQIAAIDEQRPKPDNWDIQSQKLRQELAQLRAEVDALPDATPMHR